MPRSRTTTIPPPSSARRCTARAMSPSSTPTQTMLCASCAIVEAIAPCRMPSPRTRPEADPAGAEVPLDDGDLGEVALGVGDGRARGDGRRLGERLGHDLARDDPDDTGVVAVLPRDPQVAERDRRDPHGVAHPLGHRRRRDLARGPPRGQHDVGDEPLEIGQHEQVGPVGGGHGAEARKSVPCRRVQGCHHERIGRVDALGDGVADERVHMPVGGDVLRVAVVGAERDPARAELARERDQRVQVACAGRLADEEPHAGPQPLAALLDRRRLVVGADAGRGVGLKRGPADSGCVTVGALGAVQRELRELRRIAGDHSREVHHLGQPDHPPPPQEALQIALGQRAAGRLELRRRHARRRREAHVERHPLGCVEQPVDAVGAQHVCDLVRVGDDGRRPERQHEPGELARQEAGGLEVDVRVDEAGDDVPPGRVDALVAVVAPEAGDPAVDHGHVALEPLAGEDREHPPARDDEIGRLVAACDGDPAREVGHHRRS